MHRSSRGGSDAEEEKVEYLRISKPLESFHKGSSRPPENEASCWSFWDWRIVWTSSPRAEAAFRRENPTIAELAFFLSVRCLSFWGLGLGFYDPARTRTLPTVE